VFCFFFGTDFCHLIFFIIFSKNFQNVLHKKTGVFLRVLKIINDPYDNVSLAQSFFDSTSGIKPLVVHKFIKENNMKTFSLPDLIEKEKPTLFKEENSVETWIGKLNKWLEKSQTLNVYSLIQLVGSEFLLDPAKDHDTLISRIEIIRTILHLALREIDRNSKITLKEFLTLLDRLESYDENIPLAVYSAGEGIKVLTLHSSKGLEFDYVWIAHMDEKSLMSGRRQGFILPESSAF